MHALHHLRCNRIVVSLSTSLGQGVEILQPNIWRLACVRYLPFGSIGARTRRSIGRPAPEGHPGIATARAAPSLATGPHPGARQHGVDRDALHAIHPEGALLRAGLLGARRPRGSQVRPALPRRDLLAGDVGRHTPSAGAAAAAVKEPSESSSASRAAERHPPPPPRATRDRARAGGIVASSAVGGRARRVTADPRLHRARWWEQSVAWRAARRVGKFAPPSAPHEFGGASAVSRSLSRFVLLARSRWRAAGDDVFRSRFVSRLRGGAVVPRVPPYGARRSTRRRRARRRRRRRRSCCTTFRPPSSRTASPYAAGSRR